MTHNEQMSEVAYMLAQGKSWAHIGRTLGSCRKYVKQQFEKWEGITRPITPPTYNELLEFDARYKAFPVRPGRRIPVLIINRGITMAQFLSEYWFMIYIAYFVFNFGSILVYEGVDNNGRFNFSAPELISFLVISLGFPGLVFLIGAGATSYENKKRKG